MRNYNKTIFDEISDCYPRMTNQEIRSTLAMFNFRGDDVFKDIAMLSGGERGRVVLTEVLPKTLPSALFIRLPTPPRLIPNILRLPIIGIFEINLSSDK